MAAGGGVSARTILWWLVFTGTAMNYVVRMSITIAIVAMVKGHNLPRKNNLSFSSECFNATARYRATNISYMSTNTTKVPTDDEKDKVDWDEYEQNLVLASPYWLYWLTQLFSGYATRHYGSKVVFGLSNYILCLLGLFVPFATFHSFHLLIFLMALQGAFGGFVWPSLHAVTAAWVPPNERSKFITSYNGNSLGSALTLPLCGQLIHWFGWPSVFYVTGVLGTLWYTAWVLFMFDSPEKHPRISSTERNYILEQIGKAKTNEKLSAPWLKIFTSVNVWLIIFVQWGTYWCLFTAITQTPTYLYTLHGWDIKMTGVLSGFPYILRIIVAYFMSIFCDHLLKSDKMSRTNVRKMAITISCLGQGVATLGLAFSGCNTTVAIICLVLTTSVGGVDTSGQIASMVDLSPNFASYIMSLANGITAFTGIIAPMLVGVITYQNQTSSAWQLVYLVSAIMVTVPLVFHLIFGTSEMQEWNYPTKSVTELEELREETQKLNTNPEGNEKVSKKYMSNMTQ